MGSAGNWPEHFSDIDEDIRSLGVMLRSRRAHLDKANFGEGDSLRAIVASLAHLIEIYAGLPE